MQHRANPRRGELYWLDWHPASGSEQVGRRPGLVVSNNTSSRFSGVVIVDALTTQISVRPYPFQVKVEASRVDGLVRDTIVICEQLMTRRRRTAWNAPSVHCRPT